MSQKQRAAQARLKAELIVKVRSGLLSASEAAKQLGVSRKTYYKWEKRALSGMVDGLSDRSAGRPVKEVDPEKERLKNKVEQLEKQLTVLSQTMQIRELLREAAPKKKLGRPPKKKRRKRRRIRQGELELVDEPRDSMQGVSGHGSAGVREVQHHSAAPEPGGCGENPGPETKLGSGVRSHRVPGADDRTAKKK
jgi:transposase